MTTQVATSNQTTQKVKKDGKFGKALPMVGTFAGGVLGGIYGGPSGAIGGASAGGGLGSMIGGWLPKKTESVTTTHTGVDPSMLVDRGPSQFNPSPGFRPGGGSSGNAMTRKMQSFVDDPIHNLSQAQAALKTMPAPIQAEYAPVIQESIMIARKQRELEKKA